jgi:hypothetical protein
MPNSNVIVQKQLDDRLLAIQDEMTADAIALFGPLVYGVDEHVKDSVENIPAKKKKLVVMLETTGGYIEVVQRMVQAIRHHYSFVEFIIPNYAMSAGTVFVMSGDAIHMDYFSVLGPIDPQVERPDKKLVPALGYLIKYDRLIAKSQKGTLTTAELNYLIERFDPAELYSYEQARDLSITLLKEWLAKYKFKNWKTTETRGRTVTEKMKAQRATEIAKKLNNTEFWHSHGRGISMEILRRDLNLLIEDFGSKIGLTGKIRSYHKLMTDYMGKLDFKAAIHVVGEYKPLI